MKKTLISLLVACSLTATAQDADKGNVARAEKMFGFLLKNQTDSLYENLSAQVKPMVQKQQFDGILIKIEPQVGKYLKHGEWEEQLVMGQKCYVSMAQFEKAELGALVVLDAEGKMLGIQLVPAEAVKKRVAPADGQSSEWGEVSPEQTAGAFREIADTVVTGGIRLPASILMPFEADNVPIVVMVHGSGALDRDETICDNKPFRDIAEGLAARGIATLRYDKRTFVYRQSVASMDEETILDVLSAIRLARRYGLQVYVLGHSLGAMLAPLIAERAEGLLTGVVMMAPPARDLETLVREQFDYLLPSGASPAFKEKQVDNLRLRSPHYFQPQGQTAAAQRLSLPMLILQGERDYQVTMQDFRLWRQLLEGKEGVECRSYPRLNHLFMEGTGKSTPLEYQTKGHVAMYVIDDVAAFVRTR